MRYYQLLTNATNAATGAYLSSYVSRSGPMIGWGTGTKCNDGCTGTIAAQTYKNSTITLAGTDSTFIGSLGTTYTGLKMSSDNKILAIDSINAPKMQAGSP
ncbi:hypothetical protein BJ875DRAFT_59712 [Amylocarpus encephaloides]|uniref:Uncharacterized protein n=1 Tax=Amylocarpus encephaloides TaxID=45428 RepID=A0A9P7YGZ1_9HELO|nr:hypothetical protein BJ875DRAFT_59712 [Amylocarpus encephaloides]